MRANTAFVVSQNYEKYEVTNCIHMKKGPKNYIVILPQEFASVKSFRIYGWHAVPIILDEGLSSLVSHFDI